jgi:hypothetical protein
MFVLDDDGDVWWLQPDTGEPQEVSVRGPGDTVAEARRAIPAGADYLAFGDGALWASVDSGIARIDTVEVTADDPRVAAGELAPGANATIVPVSEEQPPYAFAVGGGAAWYWETRSSKEDPRTGFDRLVFGVHRVDLATGTGDEVGRGQANEGNVLLVVGEAAVWVTHEQQCTEQATGAETSKKRTYRWLVVSRLHPGTGDLLEEPTPLPAGAVPLPVEPCRADFQSLNLSTVAVGEGGFWAASHNGGLDRVDAATGELTTSEAPEIGQLAVGAGAVWGLGTFDSDTLYEIDPVSGDEVGHTKLKTGNDGVAAGEGAVWVSAENDYSGKTKAVVWRLAVPDGL